MKRMLSCDILFDLNRLLLVGVLVFFGDGLFSFDLNAARSFNALQLASLHLLQLLGSGSRGYGERAVFERL